MHRNLTDLLTASVEAHPDRVATRERVDDAWVDHTYAELAAAVDALAAGMVREGIETGDRVAIFATNRPAWTVVDFAVLSIGAVLVPIYQTSTPEQARVVLESSGARWVFCGTGTEADRIGEVADELPGLERVVRMDTPGFTASLAQPVDDPDGLRARREAVGPDDLATLIYTSGTTGTPKGVMLTHGAFLAEIAEVRNSFDIAPEDSSLCFLPLSHALERAWTFCVLASGSMNVYVSRTAEVADMMVAARTSLMVAVPKLYAKVKDTALEQAASSPIKKRLFAWALATGRAAQEAGAEGLAADPLLRARLAVADRLVLSKVRAALGGQKKIMVAGGAAIRQDVEEFFWACGMLLYTGYGMTEAAPLMTYNSPASVRFGSVGKVMPGAELRIVAVPEVETPGEGEIQFRGPNVMLGYWANDEATEESFDGEWLRSGDIGRLDADGNLYITDRLKDLIVTQQGKNIAPAPIEEELGTDPMIAHAVLLGDDRPCVTVLISPNVPELEAWAQAQEIAFRSQEELLAHPALLDELRARVEKVSAKLPHQEKIRDLRVVLGEFSMENGLLTPTLKVRRRAVEKWYADVVEDMYERMAQARKSARAVANRTMENARGSMGNARDSVGHARDAARKASDY